MHFTTDLIIYHRLIHSRTHEGPSQRFLQTDLIGTRNEGTLCVCFCVCVCVCECVNELCMHVSACVLVCA
jgi:hypothetical protein